MRQLSHRSNLFLACLAGIATVAALRLPWFGKATPPSDPDGGASVEDMAAAIGRWFGEAEGWSGEQMLATTQTVLIDVVLATMVLSGLILIPALRAWVRDVLRLVPLAAPCIVALTLFNPPGANADIEPRWGLFVGLALTVLMACAAWYGSQLPRRREAPQPYSPPAPPTW